MAWTMARQTEFLDQSHIAVLASTCDLMIVEHRLRAKGEVGIHDLYGWKMR